MHTRLGTQPEHSSLKLFEPLVDAMLCAQLDQESKFIASGPCLRRCLDSGQRVRYGDPSGAENAWMLAQYAANIASTRCSGRYKLERLVNCV